MGELSNALTYLIQLNRNIEMQGYSFDLRLGGGEFEEKYANIYNELLKEYGVLVNDLILTCNIGTAINISGDYRKCVIDSYKSQSVCHIKNQLVEISPFLETINKMVCDNNSISEIMSVCENRLSDILTIYAKKEKLIVATRILLRDKEQEIESILI